MMLLSPSLSSSSCSSSDIDKGVEPEGTSVERAEGRKRSRIAKTDCLPLSREPLMTFVLPSNARKRESETGTGPGGMELPGVAGPAMSDRAAPDEVAASVKDGVGASSAV